MNIRMQCFLRQVFLVVNLHVSLLRSSPSHKHGMYACCRHRTELSLTMTGLSLFSFSLSLSCALSRSLFKYFFARSNNVSVRRARRLLHTHTHTVNTQNMMKLFRRFCSATSLFSTMTRKKEEEKKISHLMTQHRRLFHPYIYHCHRDASEKMMWEKSIEARAYLLPSRKIRISHPYTG